MTSLKHVLPPKLFEVVDKADISTPKQIMILSIWDLKRLTSLCTEDIILLKNLISDFIKPSIYTANLLLDEQSNTRLTSGCNALDCILGGGFRRRCITEIYGESGSGKTQLAIQAVVHNWPDCCIYICTEDLFPSKRFNTVIQSIPNYKPHVDYGNNVYVEHLTESKDLLSCVRVRIPKLLSQKRFSLIIIDSIAAPFSVDNTNYVQRAEELRTLALMLITMSEDYNLSVICINQVTASFENSAEVLPSLGLAWSNMVSTRLCVTKTLETVNADILENSSNEGVLDQNILYVRELSVKFAPDLPNTRGKFIITPINGVQGLLK